MMGRAKESCFHVPTPQQRDDGKPRLGPGQRSLTPTFFPVTAFYSGDPALPGGLAWWWWSSTSAPPGLLATRAPACLVNISSASPGRQTEILRDRRGNVKSCLTTGERERAGQCCAQQFAACCLLSGVAEWKQPSVVTRLTATMTGRGAATHCKDYR